MFFDSNYIIEEYYSYGNIANTVLCKKCNNCFTDIKGNIKNKSGFTLINSTLNQYDTFLFDEADKHATLFIHSGFTISYTDYTKKSMFIPDEIGELIESYIQWKEKCFKIKDKYKLNDWLIMLENMKFCSLLEQNKFTELKKQLDMISLSIEL